MKLSEEDGPGRRRGILHRDYQTNFTPCFPNGTYVAYVPAIEGCHAIGPTPEQAQRELQNVFDMIAEEFAESGRPLPNDVQLTVAHAG